MSTTLTPSEPRDRLLRTAAQLFYAEGITAVGVDRIVAEAGVTRATMYRHFAGKEGLVVAYLEQEDASLRALFGQAAEQTSDPQELVVAVIDGIAADATMLHRRGCPFINASAEYPDPGSAVRQVVRQHRDWFRATLAALLQGAGLDDPGQRAASLVLLRDAMLVGSYLDGQDEPGAESLEAAFRSSAARILA